MTSRSILPAALGQQITDLSRRSAAQFILEDAACVARDVVWPPEPPASVLVTGASGLIGTYLLASLRQAIKGKSTSVKVFAVVHSEPQPYFLDLMDSPGFTLLRGDLADPEFWPELPEAKFILHAAGYGQPGRFMENPVQTISLNTAVSLALFERLEPGGRFLYVSSSEVYSGLSGSPHKESEIGTTNTDHPRSCYIEGKRCGEAICHALRQRGVQAFAARLALAYGPGARERDARVLNTLIERGLIEGEIRLMDSGEAVRTYVYITDAVAMLWKILLYGRQGLYNVGGRSRTTIAELAATLGSLMGVSVSIPQNDGRLQGAPAEVSLDLGRVESEFGKAEYVPLAEGLSRTIAWQKIYRNLSE